MKNTPITVHQFGFSWGAADVRRYFDFKGHVVIGIQTPRQELEIRVTPSGFIRTHIKKATKPTP